MIFVIFIILIFTSKSVQSNDEKDLERAALETFYHAFGGDNWIGSRNWLNSSISVCYWFGISCNDDGYVTWLALDGNDISGEFPNDGVFNRLPYLERLYLSTNYISGKIPDQIAKLTNLEYLDLGVNSLGGDIPNALGSCEKLVSLRLSDNKFISLSPGISKLTKIQTLDISNNHLTYTYGYSLDFLCIMPDLEFLFLYNNNFKNSLPDCLDIFKERKYLNFDISQNFLFGQFPSTWKNQSSQVFQILKLQNNNLEGYIPDAICAVPPLLQQCDMTGNPQLQCKPLKTNHCCGLLCLDGRK